MFKSIEYYVFLFAVIIVYYSVPKKFKKHVLLTASYLVYIYWEPTLFWVLIIETIFIYLVAIEWKIENKNQIKNNIISLTVILIFSILIYYKYRPYFLINSGEIAGYYDLLRPLGISFFTFQGVAYLIDVKRGHKPSSSIIDVALYLSYFPQLVAGPIERAKKLIPQLSSPSEQYYNNFSKGLFYICYGIFLKILVADNLDLYVQQAIHSDITYYNYIIIFGWAFFFIQLYADFSAYTLIAIGSASFFGIRLSENFRQPFSSMSLAEFWKRWHITLLLWLRDYIYIPIAKNQKINKLFTRGIATFFVFMFFAVWHGISSNFLLFGLLNFILAFTDSQVLAKLKNSNYRKTMRLIFLIIGYLTIILLPANDINHAKELTVSIFSLQANFNFLPIGVSLYQFVICVMACFILFSFDYFQEKHNQTMYQVSRKFSLKKKVLLFLFFSNVLIMFGEFGNREFAYFGF